MRTLILIITVLICQFSVAQKIVEIPFKTLDKDYVELVNSIRDIHYSGSKKVISMDDIDFEKFNDLDTRHLMFWELSFHYGNLKEYDKCFEILKKGQSEGMFFAFTKNLSWPSYLKELNNFDEFQSFVEQNETLKKENESIVDTEFMVQVPEAYDESKNYPLLLVMHGGSGCIPDVQYSYDSQKLKSDFIVAYFQGSIVDGSYIRSFSRNNWAKHIIGGFNQIITKYAVDTTKIILAGQSLGGFRSINLGLNNQIPARGLILNFPVIPRNIQNQTYLESKERGLKVVQLCGENDWAIQPQKEFAYWLDKYMIKNRFVVFPEVGHGYPENFQHHLETSIEFLLKED